MTLRIREADLVTGAGDAFPVEADAVRMDLGIIASGGTGELDGDFGDEPDPASEDFSIVVYAPDPAGIDTTTDVGRVKQRLKDLVDRAETVDLVGLGEDFEFPDGATVETRTGSSFGGEIWYDTTNCLGRGRWIRGENGDEECTTSAVILYHELAHSFLGHSATLDPPDVVEPIAVDEENVMRRALGMEPRDRNRWPEAGCDCPNGGCCIVASVVSGSPWSEEVNLLRRLRDKRLRADALGWGLFERIHREYYAFSVEISRLLVADEEARSSVRSGLVEPFVRMLRVLEEYRRTPRDARRVGHALREALRASPDVDARDLACFEAVLDRLKEPGGGTRIATDAPTLRRIFDLLQHWMPHSPSLQWGILEVLRIHAAARRRFGNAGSDEEAGRWLIERAQRWLADTPVTDELRSLPLAARRKLAERFAAGLLEDPAERAWYAAQLLARSAEVSR